jgi:arginine-tRNA-protein transferase
MERDGKSVAPDSSERGMRSRALRSSAYGNQPLSLDFLVTMEPTPCPYLPDQISNSEFFFTDSMPGELYHDFMNHGFRRSGDFFYRPKCPQCNECKPLRVRVPQFRPGKSQRRNLRRNQDLRVKLGKPEFTDEKARMYKEYLKSQHNSDKAASPEDLRSFLYSSPVDTFEFLYFLQDRLVAVSIADICARSLSSVYVFFDPEHARRGLGTYSALFEISFCAKNSIPFYYLGYYVAQCRSMNYKARFRPCETMDPEGTWSIINNGRD